MGFRSKLRTEAIEALLEGLGIPDKYASRAAKAINQHLMEGYLMKPKAGWRTTEFWLAALTTIGSVGGSLAGILPEKAGIWAGIIATAAYSISRGLAKVGSPPPME